MLDDRPGEEKALETKSLGTSDNLRRQENIDEALSRYSDVVSLQAAADHSIPLFYQLARILRNFVLDNSLAPGDRIPSQEAICSAFEVSRPTAVKAVQELVSEGWVAPVRGKGTFITDVPSVQLALLSNTLSPAEELGDAPLTTRVVSRKTGVQMPHIAGLLGIEERARLVFFRRLRILKGRPLFVGDSYLPEGRFPGLGESELVGGSLYRTLTERYGCPIVRSDRWVEAGMSADSAIATLLGMPLLAPLLIMSGITVTTDDEPIEHIRCHFQDGVSLKSSVRPRSAGGQLPGK